VVVVGASQDPTKRGYQVVRALVEGGYQGRVHPVNPRGGELLGLPVSRSVAEVDGDPELAVVCTPGEVAPEVVAACGRRGIAGAVILAVGFRESGGRGAALERRLLAAAREGGVRVVGPNTSGLMNLHLGMDVIGIPGVRPGPLGLVTQSGNTTLSVLTEGARREIGFSTVVGLGNEMDVGFHDMVEYLGDDPDTRAILLHAEGFTQGRAFLEAARRVAHRKPLVLLKGGRSGAGGAVARSHTGAVATGYPVVRAALRQAGVIEVARSDELLAVARTLAFQPPAPSRGGVAILSDGGGQATVAADTLEELGIPLAVLAPATRRQLRSLLGRAAAVANPVDLAGAADRDPGAFHQAARVILADPAVGGLLVIGLFGGYAVRFSPALAGAELEAARGLAGVSQERGRPLVLHSIYEDRTTPPLTLLRDAGIPVLASVETACRAMGAVMERGRGLARSRNGASLELRSPRRRKVGRPAALVTPRNEGRILLLETEVRELLSSYPVSLVPAVFCAAPEEAAGAAKAAGGPVVLRSVSGTITHKSEAGGVELAVQGGRGAAAAFRRIRDSLHQYARGRGMEADFRGVLVSPHLPTPVVELLAGVRIDPVFGPVLTLGAGGTAVEVLRDFSVRVLPVRKGEVLEMMDELRIAPLLRGHRGRPGVDRDALAVFVMGLSACALEHPELAELEANPIFAGPEGVTAVDLRGYLAPAPGTLPGAPPGGLPKARGMR